MVYPIVITAFTQSLSRTRVIRINSTYVRYLPQKNNIIKVIVRFFYNGTTTLIIPQLTIGSVELGISVHNKDLIDGLKP